MVFIAVIGPFLTVPVNRAHIMTSTPFRMLCLKHFMQVHARKHTCKTGKGFELLFFLQINDV